MAGLLSSPVQGTWFNLPDYGFTELLRDVAGKRPSAEVTTNFNNPAVIRAQGITTAPPVQNKTNQTTNKPLQPLQPLRANNTPAAPQQVTNPGVNEAELAAQRRRSMIDSYRSQANNLRNEAQGTFDNILKQVNSFRDRSKTLYNDAGQEIVNRASGILGENARNAVQQEGEARARGRALGLGDSSKLNLQNRLAGNFAATQGNTIARRGEEDRANSANYQERLDQAQGQENEANTYLKGARDRATALENAGYDAADETYAGALNDIVNYSRSLAAINPVNVGGLTQYAPNFSGISNTVNNVLSSLKGGGQNSEDDFANPVNPQDIFSILKQRGLVY